jgi:uncharacterized protein (DUF58 family)
MKQRIPLSRLALRPTAAGGFWLLAVVALLATAINYGNNLVFALAFLLLAVWLQAAWNGWRNLAGLHWQASTPMPVFANAQLRIEGRLTEQNGRPRLGLMLVASPVAGAADPLAANGEATLAIALPTGRRGPMKVRHLALASTYPLGLWRCQRPLPAVEALVYPVAGGDAALPVTSPRPAHRSTATNDFQGLRAYTPGDPPRRINWRAWGRREELLVNQFDGDRGGDALWLDWANCPGAGDARLAQLTRWVLDAERTGADYGLRLPDTAVPTSAPARGRVHRDACLRRLALFDLAH